MGAVAGGALAGAVTRAGGLGLIGPGYLDEAWINREFDAAGNTQVGIGFITWHLTQHPQRLDAALATWGQETATLESLERDTTPSR